MDLNKMRDDAHDNSVMKGWWPEGETHNIPEKLMLIVTEVAEAMEAYRIDDMKLRLDEKGKPEGFEAELADIVIRIGDLCGWMNIDLDEAVRVKMAHNKTRPHRHGGKKA